MGATRTNRRRPLACPVERCGQAFHTDEKAAAATHAAAAHTVCSCGWVGLGFTRHQSRALIGNAPASHRRVAVVRAKTNGFSSPHGATKPADGRPADKPGTPPQPRPRRVQVWESTLDDWRSGIEFAAERAHETHHSDGAYPYDWRRCWEEPCSNLSLVIDAIGMAAR